MDGPFMCVDPYGSSGNFVLGNVVHAIHSRNVGKFPIIDKKFKSLLNNNIIKNPTVTNFERFISSASEFMPQFRKAKHLGSMFTIRVVPPHVDDTDERPTVVRKISSNIIAVFSGKIPTCVNAAEEVKKLISLNKK